MSLEAHERAIRLAEIWEDDAKRIRKYQPDAPGAATLEKCAEQVREVVARTHPTEVSLPAIRTRTGWSMGVLRKWAREKWSPDGNARRRGGRWLVSYETAIEVPVKQNRDLSEFVGKDGQPTDIEGLARAMRAA